MKPRFRRPSFAGRRRRLTKDPTASGLEGMDDAHLRVYLKKLGAVMGRISEVGLPQPGEQLRLVTRRKFNAIEFLTYIAETEGVTRMAAAIYSINQDAARQLVRMIDDGRIDHVEILMSNLRNGAHREKEMATRLLLETHPKISLFLGSSHAKVMAMRTRAGNAYVIEGSGNHANNSRVEQYVIDNDEGVYQFVIGWIAETRAFLEA